MIPTIFHRIWLGPKPVSAEAEALHASWLEKHPGWESRLWRDDDFGWLENQVLFDRSRSYAQRADIARYEIVRKFGGVFLDMDMECLRTLSELLHAEVSFFAGRQGGQGLIANGLFGAVPDHPLLTQAISYVPVSCLLNRNRGIYKQTGPGLLTTVVEQYGWEHVPGIRIFPLEFFYPYFANEPWRRLERFPRAYAVHHWAGSWNEDKEVRVGVVDLVPTGLPDALVKLRGLGGGLFLELSEVVERRVVRVAKREVKSLVGRMLPDPPRSVHGVPWGPDHVLVAGPLRTRLLVPVEDLSIAPYLALDGVYEPTFVRFLMRVLRPGMTFVDVGANVGLFTVVAARVLGPGGRVYAYECNPELVDVLRQNVHLNWLNDRVEIVPKAAGLDTAPLKFWRSRRLKMLGSTVQRPAAGSLLDENEEIEVPSEPLPDRLGAVPFVDLIKIDVEGGEAAVLAGARPLFERSAIGMVCLEFRADALTESAREEVEARLTELRERFGATFHVPDDDRSIPLDEVLVRCDFEHLLVRLPGSTVSPC